LFSSQSPVKRGRGEVFRLGDKLEIVIKAVEEFGLSVEKKWQAFNFDPTVFPQLAADALSSSRLHETVEPDDLVAAAFRGEVPAQCDPEARFGQPPLTLFRGRRFHVDALFWIDGTTAIHDHSFAGAFQLLKGSSIETTYSFASQRDVDGHLQLGKLAVDTSVLRGVGDVRAVPAGPSFIHALFHLARPSVTLVIRMFKDPHFGVQMEYSPAGIAHDSFFEDPWRDRVVQLMDMLRRTEHAALERHFSDVLAKADLGTAFSLVRGCVRWTDADMVNRSIASIRDPEAAETISRWLTYRRRTEFLISRRSMVHQAHLRFFLAVLLNTQRRRDALGLVAAFSKAVEPEQQVAAWLSELAETKLKLQVGNTPFEPNVLALPGIDSQGQTAIADFLSGRTSPHTATYASLIERLRALPALSPLFVE
jgi:hypothetical protein